MDKINIQERINSVFLDNNSGEISPLKLRDYVNYVLDAMANSGDLIPQSDRLDAVRTTGNGIGSQLNNFKNDISVLEQRINILADISISNNVYSTGTAQGVKLSDVTLPNNWTLTLSSNTASIPIAVSNNTLVSSGSITATATGRIGLRAQNTDGTRSIEKLFNVSVVEVSAQASNFNEEFSEEFI